MKGERYRHEESRLVQQIDDCIGECHRNQRMIHLESIVEDADQNAAEGKVKIRLSLRDTVIECTSVDDDDGVGCSEEAGT